MIKFLTVAGSDCSGGAGIQADIKTATVLGAYAMSVITALTAQNTTGVYGIYEADPEFVKKQIDCVFSDIRPDAVKIGMVSNAEIIGAIAAKLREYGAPHVVADPVMVATSGSRLLDAGAERVLINELLPVAELITPNIPEAEVLSGHKIENTDDMLIAAQRIAQEIPGSVLVKGGHLTDCADDILYSKKTGAVRFCAKRVNNSNTHGTGCTLSSAIACFLAAGNSAEDSVRLAKSYLTGALEAGLDLGNGSGPVKHNYCVKGLL